MGHLSMGRFDRFLRGEEGLFITVEGGEGVGKSTFLNGLQTLFIESGISEESLLLTREPGGTGLANEIRNIFTKVSKEEKLTPEAEYLLVSAARSQHLTHVVKPALRQKKVVLCDRFLDSSFVYQGALAGLDENFMKSIADKIVGKLRPHVTFLLDCEVEVALSRVLARAEQQGEAMSRYDAAEISVHEKIRKGFLEISEKEPERVIVLDASLAQKNVLEAASEWLLREGVLKS